MAPVLHTVQAPIPLLDLSREFALIRDEVMDAIEQVCARQQFVLGPAAERFEQAAASACAAHAAIGCSSGTDALWLALASLGIGPGHAVITTPFSFFATVSSILRVGATPLLADIDPQTFNLDPSSVASALETAHANGQTVAAILPVHLYGQCADMDAFGQLAAKHNLRLIEDAAQAFGALWNGRPAGSLGDTAAFSFYPTKNLSAFGDAGMITVNDPAVAERARALRNHGMRRRYFHDDFGGETGWNSRLDGIQAAVLEVKLRRLPAGNARRRDLAALYDANFRAAGLAAPRPTTRAPQLRDSPTVPSDRAPQLRDSLTASQPAGRVPHLRDSLTVAKVGEAPQTSPAATKDGLILPYTDPRAEHVFHQYVIRAPRRDDLRAFLTERNIGSEIYYPLPLHLQESLASLGYKQGDFPVAEQAAAEVLALPIYPELRKDEVEAVVDAIRSFYA